MTFDPFEVTKSLQHVASDPAVSSFVAANAGSGKTYVLSMRVIRLLLNEVDPAQILCLTFTKVAAANMATRIFKILADWTRLSDAELKAQIEAYGELSPSEAMMSRARQLFALAVEAPGGLKIQTIHAFCERLLHVFPFEANVPAGFRVIQDLEQADRMAQAQDFVLTSGTTAIVSALEILVPETDEQSFSKLLNDALRKRELFSSVISFGGFPLEKLKGELIAALGLGAEETPEFLKSQFFSGGFSPPDMLRMASALGESSRAGKLLLEAARTQTNSDEIAAQMEAYALIFNKKDGEPRKDNGLSASQSAAHPEIVVQFERETERLGSLGEKMRAAAIARNSHALIVVVDAVIQRYRDLKGFRSSLDFDDLIERTQKLLSGDSSTWVLYKLDQGIDHILIDEAQDTSPAQWGIFNALVAEFFSGKGRTPKLRTVFAVGDEKQSIYSFQGAQPQLFAQNSLNISTKVTEAQLKFEEVRLNMSFRSSPEILDAVDRVFQSNEINAQGLSFGPDGYPPHTALKHKLRGHVEIWPLFAKAPKKQAETWLLPVDFISEEHPRVRLAKQLAKTIAGWLSPGSRERVHSSDGAGRPIRAGDILILVRSRSNFAEGLNRELKLLHVPVAGADRLKLAGHIAVLDLIAVGRASLLPLDDLQVACVLKSPLFGFDDDDLIRLAPLRGAQSLLQAMQASEAPHYVAAAERLRTWQTRATSLSPFQFYMNILAGEQGRKAILSRLGQEAADVLDEFLSAALTHEAAGAPSLVKFLSDLENSDAEIKRDFDAAGDTVRVMTVHSAKGLEAKIVILADTGNVPNGSKDAKFFQIPRIGTSGDPNPLLAWLPRKGEACAAVQKAQDTALALALEEHRRLLYVAMTRAEERLYVAGYHTRQPDDKAPTAAALATHAASWYGMIKDALQDGMVATEAAWEPGQMILSRSRGDLKPGQLAAAPAEPQSLPAWLRQPLRFEAGVQPPLRPSSLLSAADTDDIGDIVDEEAIAAQPAGEQARLSGQMIHRLLQILPAYPDARRDLIGDILLQREGTGLSRVQRRRVIDEAMRVLALSELQSVFSPEARAEVSICGEVAYGDKKFRVLGRIDRLVVLPSEVIVVDFKSGTKREAAIGQMALYYALLGQIYPDHRISAAIVWTREPAVDWLDAVKLRRAMDALSPA